MLNYDNDMNRCKEFVHDDDINTESSAMLNLI